MGSDTCTVTLITIQMKCQRVIPRSWIVIILWSQLLESESVCLRLCVLCVLKKWCRFQISGSFPPCHIFQSDQYIIRINHVNVFIDSFRSSLQTAAILGKMVGNHFNHAESTVWWTLLRFLMDAIKIVFIASFYNICIYYIILIFLCFAYHTIACNSDR